MKKYFVLFLGQGRIAAEVVGTLVEEFGDSSINMNAISTNPEFFESMVHKYKLKNTKFINNKKRNIKVMECIISKETINCIISVQHPWVIPSSSLSLVNNFAFNLHNAKLPNYKGYNSLSHALHNGDSFYTSTVHWMIPNVDMGDIAYEAYTSITKDDDALSLYLKTINASVKAFRSLINDLLTDNDPPRKKIIGEGQFFSRMAASSLKDVSDVTDQIELERRVRACFFPPFEPAFIKIKEKKYHLVPERLADATWKHLVKENLPQWDI
jgi:methionyl-tRNA formyltransferase